MFSKRQLIKRTMKYFSMLLAIAFHLVFFIKPLYAQDSLFTNSIGMEFVLIKPGSFVMGRFQPPYPKPSEANKNNEGSGERGYSAAEFKLAEEMATRDAMPGFTVQ